MKKQRFVKQTEIPAPVERVFAFHERPDAFRLLMPPWERSEIIQTAETLEPGARTIIRTFIGPLSRLWIAEHTEYTRNRSFTDIQLKGPFAYWRHRHLFEPTESGTTLYTDEIEYAVPFGWLGEIVAGRMVRKRLERLLEYRHRVVVENTTSGVGSQRSGVGSQNKTNDK
ncbi:MAG: SRPBCC family protein [Acidobacteriota bacterium]